MDAAVLTNFNESLKVLAYGMGGIFTVLILIFVLIKGLIKIFPEK
jgi:Na+-transporting methylmalonyl-CoA/oxaloacetate decarboxylase gamma subunit